MRLFGVKEVSRFSGVSPRTLHHYDRIGLLKPAERRRSGYRYYGEAELLRLQQILFYKELDFSLKEIKAVLDDPAFNVIDALEQHKVDLARRQHRIAKLVETIDQTISKLKTGRIMNEPKDLYEGLPREMGTGLRDEAIEKYGQAAIEVSEGYLISLGKEAFVKLQSDLEHILQALSQLTNESPESEVVQQVIDQHYRVIRQLWGTAGTKNPQVVDYEGLGQLYVDDPRYATLHGQPQTELAQLMASAMTYYARTALK